MTSRTIFLQILTFVHWKSGEPSSLRDKPCVVVKSDGYETTECNNVVDLVICDGPGKSRTFYVEQNTIHYCAENLAFSLRKDTQMTSYHNILQCLRGVKSAFRVFSSL